jgi:hypothetical protein
MANKCRATVIKTVGKVSVLSQKAVLQICVNNMEALFYLIAYIQRTMRIRLSSVLRSAFKGITGSHKTPRSRVGQYPSLHRAGER